ncbi:MAG: hypothetical protein GY773_11150, partial [Actinomycetia bacterium]|nr:hypothetical protein [Actinomycetes bacterium]
MGVAFGPGRWFRVSATGMDDLPPSPSLVVMNHSGGTTIPDVWGWLYAWYNQVGVDRPLHPLGHDMIFQTRATGRYFATRGLLRAHREVALAALKDHGRDVLVFPGGDLDTWRPYGRRYKVSFGGRKGYARLAIRAGVPIVPVAHAGAHETLVVLAAGRRVARSVRLRQLVRANIWPVHLSLPWGLAIGPWPHLPPPMRLRYRAAEPIDVGPAEDNPNDARVEELDRRVQAALQAELDVLASERAAPLER